MGSIIFLPAHGRDVAHLVTAATLVTIPTERKVGGKVEYGTAAYTALEVRAATAEEVERWRWKSGL